MTTPTPARTAADDWLRELEAMFHAPSGTCIPARGLYVADWEDKPHRVLYDAVAIARQAIDALLLKDEEIKRQDEARLQDAQRIAELKERLDNEALLVRREITRRRAVERAAEARATSAWNDAIKEAGKVAERFMFTPGLPKGQRHHYRKVAAAIRALSRPVEAE